MALQDLKVNEWDKTRDYFVCYMVSMLQATQGGKWVEPELLLAHKYLESDTVNYTHDPDEGAIWESAPITEGTFKGEGEEADE